MTSHNHTQANPANFGGTDKFIAGMVAVITFWLFAQSA